MADASLIREKILSLIRIHGPSLPVFIARETGLSILFASAFLSELLSDKEIKLSNMRIGSSPIYFLSGQEPLLENFSQYLKNKEKEAFTMLKEKRFLIDRELEPAIRVALRQIKDFAIPFQREGEIIWRYFTEEESGFVPKSGKIEEIFPEEKIKEIIPERQTEVINEETEIPESGKEIIIEEEGVEIKKHAKKHEKKMQVKKQQKKKSQDSRFFNRVKELLAKKKIEILDIEEISMNRIIFRVKDREEYLVIAYNKKKISEQDIISSYKKSREMKMPYKIWALGEPAKKFDVLMSALKDLKSMEKIE